MAQKNLHKDFSDELEEWLSHPRTQRTLGELESVFNTKSAPIGIMVLMALPALPVPTGGLSHVFEVIAIFLASGMIIGAGRFWIPKKYKKTKLSGKTQEKLFKTLVRFIKFFERFSSPRLTWFVNNGIVHRFVGLITIIFTLFAFFSPPFSFLDTLPAMGVVLMMLGVILEDTLLLIAGLLVGVFGCTLAFIVARTAYSALLNFI